MLGKWCMARMLAPLLQSFPVLREVSTAAAPTHSEWSYYCLGNDKFLFGLYVFQMSPAGFRGKGDVSVKKVFQQFAWEARCLSEQPA